MYRLVDKLNTPMAVVIIVVLAVSVNGLLYLYLSRDSQLELSAEKVQAFPRAEASSDPLDTDTSKGEEPDDPAQANPKKRQADKDPDKEAPQLPRRSEGTKRSEDAEHKNRPDTEGKSQKEPSSTQEPSGPIQPTPSSSEAALEGAPPVEEASSWPAPAPQEAPPAATAPATAPATATATDASTSEDYNEAGQASSGTGGGDAPLASVFPTTQDVSPAPQVAPQISVD